MNQPNETDTFGGWPVKMRAVGDDVIINCKNVTGTYSQLRSFVRNEKYPFNNYQFGIKTSEPAQISNTPDGRVKIACLDDSRDNFMRMYDKAGEMIGVRPSVVRL